MSDLKTAKRRAKIFMSRKKTSFCRSDLAKVFPIESTGMRIRAGQHFFRSVKWDESPSKIAQLSYPPKEFVKERGRCNEVAKSVFYVSTEKSAVFAEQKELSVGSTYAVGQWELISDLWVHLIGFPQGHPLFSEHYLDPENAISAYWNTIFHKCFRKKGSGSYPQTIAIYENAVSTGILTQNGKRRPLGVAFPSVDHPNPEALAINLACDDQVADQFFKLVGAIFVKVTKISGGLVEYDFLEQATGNYSDGRILWERPVTIDKSYAVEVKKVVIPSAAEMPYAVTDSGLEIELEPKKGFVDFNVNHKLVKGA